MKIFGKEIGGKKPKDMFVKRVENGVQLTIEKKGQPKRIIVDMDNHEEASDRIWENLRRGHASQGFDLDQ